MYYCYYIIYCQRMVCPWGSDGPPTHHVSIVTRSKPTELAHLLLLSGEPRRASPSPSPASLAAPHLPHLWWASPRRPFPFRRPRCATILLLSAIVAILILNRLFEKVNQASPSWLTAPRRRHHLPRVLRLCL